MEVISSFLLSVPGVLSVIDFIFGGPNLGIFEQKGMLSISLVFAAYISYKLFTRVGILSALLFTWWIWEVLSVIHNLL